MNSNKFLYPVWLLFLILTTCGEREFLNPFDQDFPKELFTPADFKAEQIDDGIMLTWKQENQNISGFIINRGENGNPLAEVARVSKTTLSWNDTNVFGSKEYNYQLYAYAGANLSNSLDVSITAKKDTVTNYIIFEPLIISSITSTSALVASSAQNVGGVNVMEFGICYGLTENPSVNSNVLKIHSIQNIQFTIIGLTPGNKYFVRGYALTDTDIFYGPEKEFVTDSVTSGPPVVLNAYVTDVSENSATLVGVVNANNSSTIVTFEFGTSTSYGSIINAAQNPITGTNETVSAEINDLVEGTEYHFRVKAENELGTSYSNDVTFTYGVPIVITGEAENIGLNSATLNGIINPQGYDLQVSFFVYSTDIYGGVDAQPKNISGYDDIQISADLKDLKANSYYGYRLRAYSSLLGGYTWGEMKYFYTLAPDKECSDLVVIHKEGEVAPETKTITYKTVLPIGTGNDKCWLAQNLGADQQATSPDYNTESEAGWYWQFNRKQGYRFDGTKRIPDTEWVTSISEASNWTAENDPCTILLGMGWRIPSDSEWSDAFIWNNINDAFNSNLRLKNSGFFDHDYAKALKLMWGGYWSSSQSSFTGAYSFQMDDNYGFGIKGDFKSRAYSIRCIKD